MGIQKSSETLTLNIRLLLLSTKDIVSFQKVGVNKIYIGLSRTAELDPSQNGRRRHWNHM